MAYFKSAQGILLVYDISNMESYKRVKEAISNLKRKNINSLVYVIGNKIDLKEHRVIKKEDVVRECIENNIKYYEVSAKTGEGINELFYQIVIEFISDLENKLIIKNKIVIKDPT